MSDYKSTFRLSNDISICYLKEVYRHSYEVNNEVKLEEFLPRKPPYNEPCVRNNGNRQLIAEICRILGGRVPRHDYPRYRTTYRRGASPHIKGDVHIIMEPYGIDLPVFIIEAITAMERLPGFCVILHESGYGILVCGRRLLIWKYKLEYGMKKSMVPYCRELHLPNSGLAHRAQLVQIFKSRNEVTSCVAVSQEGFIRYWPNVAREGSSFDAHADLKGEGCYSLTSVGLCGFILATSIGSLFLVKTSLTDGQPQIHCLKLELPQGFLTGIARRVTSLIYKVVPKWSSKSKEMKKVLTVPEGDDSYCMYVLNGNVLQKWYLSAGVPYKLMNETNLENYVKEEYLDTLSNGDSSQKEKIKIQCLDIQCSKNGVIVLTAGSNPSVSKDIHYAFGVLNEYQQAESRIFSSFVVTKYSEKVMEQQGVRVSGYKFLYPQDSEDKAYIYDSYKVICMPVLSVKIPAVFNLSHSKDVILGYGSCEEIPLLFTKLHGIVSLKSQGFEQELRSETEQGALGAVKTLQYSE